jgi:hypothetical protein
MQGVLPKLTVVRQKAVGRASELISSNRFLVGAAMLVCFYLLFAGIRGDTPITVEGDEFCYVPSAVYMAASDTWNPRWFINPGSTVFYPLTIYYRFLNAAVFNGTWFTDMKSCDEIVFGHMYLVCLVPRYLSIAYTVFSIPLLYLFARKVFNRHTALISVWFMALSPILINYGQVIRTDAPSTFFGMLSMYLCTKVFDAPTIKNQLLTGISIGLAVASRYFMLALAPILFLINCMTLSESPREKRWQNITASVVGMVSIVVAFLASTPYFILDFKTVMSDMKFESQSAMVGCDNLGTLGNLNFYLTDAIPSVLFLPQTFLAVLGAALVIWQRQRRQVVWLVYIAVVLVGSSINTRHWDRWVIPILPILMVLAAYALSSLIQLMLIRLKATPKLYQAANVVVTCLMLVALLRAPYQEIVEHNIMKATYSCEATVYKWIKANIPLGTKIALDGGWPWGFRERYKLLENIWRPDFVKRDLTYDTPQKLARDGYKYMIVMEWFKVRYTNDPVRFPHEAHFYQELVKNYPVAHHTRKMDLAFFGDRTVRQRGSPIIIYDLQPAKSVIP